MAGSNARMNRREFLEVTAGAGLAAATLAVPGLTLADAAAKRPNIIYVFADQHRAASVGCYGDTQVRTPHMDALAKQGLRLTSAISNTPVCCPYRASLMSGLNCPHNRVMRNGLVGRFDHKRDPVLGRTFAKAGYACAYIGKWHLGDVSIDPGDPRRLGFDDYWAANVSEHNYYKWTYHTGKGQAVKGEGFYRPQMETDLAMQWLRRRPKDKPFCLFVSWGPPHTPWRAPREYAAHYTKMTLRKNVPQDKARSVLRNHIQYNGLIEGLDVQLGRLLAELDKLGLTKDTIIVYTADHGEMMGSHGWYKKRRPHRESLEVPFIVRWPGRVKPGATSDAILSAHDVFPTLAGLAGLKVPAGLDGQDASGILLGRADARQREHDYITLISDRAYVPTWKGVRTPRYTYARSKDGPWVLFDRREDPYETTNLVKTAPKVAKELEDLTAQYMRRYGDSTW